MARSSGTYTAPANSWNPAVEGTAVDESDWNDTLQDIEDAITESVYTAGLGATDNVLLRTDGTDTKKAQGSGVTCDDDVNVGGIKSVRLTPVTVANLPTAVTGMLAIVSDATATTARSAVSGGGANQVLVMRIASAWIIVA